MQTNTKQTQSKELLGQARDKIRFKRYIVWARKNHIARVKQFILYHQKRHPLEMGAVEVQAFFLSGCAAACVLFYPESGIVGNYLRSRVNNVELECSKIY